MEKKKRVSEAPKPKVISLNMDAAFFFERAVQSLDRLHYDKALKYFRRAVEYETDNPVNHCNLAGVLSEMGNYEESNRILQEIVDTIDPDMTECYFYMANNYANMENYEQAETALVRYLETDPAGQFLEESEEMMELLSYELERPAPLTCIKSREGLFEHDKARALLEEGKFAEAVRLLEKLVKNHGDFLAARNNLALAYYYMGQFEKSMDTIKEVLELDSGNLHALCNLAIFHQHFGNRKELAELLEQLRKTFPFQQDHVFKLATTMGILGEHSKAYHLFKRLIKAGEGGSDPCLHHYAAVAACHIGRYVEAERHWRQVEKTDPGSEIAKFYLEQLRALPEASGTPTWSYHYHLPFEEQFRVLEKSSQGIPEQLKKDPLVRSSFFWALRHGDMDTKLQVIQAFGLIADNEVKDALRDFIQERQEDDYLKKVAIFVLRSIGVRDPLPAYLDGAPLVVQAAPFAPNLPVWQPKWQEVMETAQKHMHKRYDMIQQHDLEILWVEFLTRVYPDTPKIQKAEGWAAALEYLIAKMHRRAISYQEVAVRYEVTVSTVSKNVKLIDEACGLREKMEAIFPKFLSMEKQGPS
ncbi:tetratricopeptide repeat protein [Paenibacillus athensensis]|uniref:DDE transposase family protein n=1 Tax=Paenibacillus athensensis TaxID=1967502 RepID=A0A4Y8PZG0_9BACL|nr:tetratricopeptide repeat protein [Paenibacillus athensensis]MCD1258515.1 tetratricopeptide repeat protein [Paenibacillus athensensis]